MTIVFSKKGCVTSGQGIFFLGGGTVQLSHRVFKCLGEISCGPDSDYIAVKTVITILSNIALPGNVSHGEYY